MTRYIDADALYELGHYDDFDEYVVDWKTIDKMPTADVVERKKGKWKDEWFDHKLKLVCSNCGCFADKMTYYCPNCGAEMEVDS